MLSSLVPGTALLPVVSRSSGSWRPAACNGSRGRLAGARQLKLITHPAAIAPRASEAFTAAKVACPDFASPDSPP